MGGKAAILLVLGFSMIFLIFGHNFSNLSTRAVDNMTDYYAETQAFNIANAGANIAANQIFMDRTWDDGYTNLSFGGGTINVFVTNNVGGTTGKVVICHIPPGNPDAQHTMNISGSALAAHLAHGDYVGPCGGGATYNDQIATIISEGTYNNVTKTIIVELQPSNFAKFGNYYSTISAYPATGDVFNGPFHTNGRLTTYGTPIFNGKVTTRNGLRKLGSPPDPQFLGGYEDGVDVPLEFDTTGLRSSSDLTFRGTSSPSRGIDVRLYFNDDGTLTYSSKAEGAGSWTAEQTVSLGSLTNGVIYVEKGNIYTKGTVNGAVTIVATKKGRTGFGNVYQEDNLQYHDNPLTEEDSDDMLGIVAEENVRIDDNVNTRGKDITTQASMFAMNGNIGPEDGLVSQSFLGDWNILGGLIASTTRVTAQYSGSTPVRGLRFIHTYDQRFLVNVPPSFPHTRNFEVVSWYE